MVVAQFRIPRWWTADYPGYPGGQPGYPGPVQGVLKSQWMTQKGSSMRLQLMGGSCRSGAGYEQYSYQTRYYSGFSSGGTMKLECNSYRLWVKSQRGQQFQGNLSRDNRQIIWYNSTSVVL